MRSAVDTNVISALLAAQPGATAAERILADARSKGGIVICAVVYAELIALPTATTDFIDGFLADAEIDIDTGFTRSTLIQAGRVYRSYSLRRKKSGGGEPRRLIPDFLIGAHAVDRANRLITFNPADYKLDFPDLTLAP